MNTTRTALMTLALLAAPLAHAQSTTSTAAISATTQTITVARVELKGFTHFDPAQVQQALAQRLNIKPGAQVNTQTLEIGRQLLAQSYADDGYLFTPEVKLTQTSSKEGTVITYSVDESAPLSRVEVSGATLLDQSAVKNAFQPLQQSKRFTPDGYTYALTQLAQAYSAKGIAFNAQSVTSSLASGTLKVNVAEPFVDSVDTSALRLGTQPALQTRAGQPLQIAAVNADARSLSNTSGQAVSWQAMPVAEGSSRLRVSFFHDENASNERVKTIVIKGNTSVPTADIQKILRTQVGDVANQQLAQQDYYAIQKLYDERGYGLAATQDSLDYQNGTLTFNLHEARIGAYKFNWEGGTPLIREQVLTHQLPPVGSPFNRPQLQAALASVSGYDNFTLVSRDAQALDPQYPENLTLTLNFALRSKSIPVGLAASYDTNNGLGGQFTYSSNNLLRTGNALSTTLGVHQNDVGQRFSGSVNYTIPWIDTSFLNLNAKPTSLSIAAWSQASGNNTLYTKDADGLPTSTDTGRQYTTRNTGVGLTLNRQLTPQLSGQMGVRLSTNSTTLEPYKSTDSTTSSTTYQNDTQASTQLPLGNSTALATLGLNYDTTNSGVYPTQGLRTSGSMGYGFGVQTDQSRLSWGQIEGGASTYYGFGRTMTDGSKQTVLAARVNAGTLAGTPGESNVYSIGNSMNPAYELRGQTTTQTGTTYLTASTELRHNFGVKLGSVVNGVYGLAFVDAGDTWRPGSTTNTFGLNTAYGLGAQLNTSFINLQVNYGLSSSGGGKFTVRLGNFW